MLSLNRRKNRQKGLKNRRGKRKRRIAHMVVPAVVTTALLLPLISGALDSYSDGTTDGTTVASSDATGSGGADGSGTSGGSTGSGDSGGGTSTGTSGTGTSDGGSSGGTSGTSTAATGGSSSSSGSGDSTTSGSGVQSGLTLDFVEDPNSGTSLDPAMDTTLVSAGETVTGTGSAFDEFPGGDLFSIEEEWELTVTEPDPAVASPQVGTIMTPFEDAGNFHLAFVVNHRFNPSLAAGGMELQLWYQGQQLGWFTFGEALLSTANEKIKWTQRLELIGGKLRFTVKQGKSTTWGDFGSGNSLHLELPTTLTDLNDYHPNVSAENSGVLYASNRVSTLVLKQVRGYDKWGELLLQDTDPVVVFGPE